MVAQVHPQQKRLELRLLRVRMPVTPEDARLARAGASRRLGRLFLQTLMPAFEVGRQLRIDIALADITAAHLAAAPRIAAVHDPLGFVGADAGASVLTLDVSAAPRFATRRMATAASLPAAWRRRRDFTAGGAASRSRRVQLVGISEDISALAALLCAVEPRIGALLTQAVGTVLPAPPPAVDAPAAGAAPAAPVADAPLSAAAATRRADIVRVLLSAELITAAEAEAPPVDVSNGTRLFTLRGEPLNNRLGGLASLIELGDCASDYLNFRCMDASDLEAMLWQPIAKDDYEGSSSEDEEDEDDERTLAALLRRGRLTHQGGGGDESYFSFCRGEVMNTCHDTHCSRCHECSDWHYWHCRNCDRCSYGQSIPTCQHCGGSSGWRSRPPKRHVARSVRMNNLMDGASSDEDDVHDSGGDDPAGAALRPGASDSDEDVVDWPPEQTGGVFVVTAPLPAAPGGADAAFDDAERAATRARFPEDEAPSGCLM